jgi:hypothetical protein
MIQTKFVVYLDDEIDRVEIPVPKVVTPLVLSKTPQPKFILVPTSHQVDEVCHSMEGEVQTPVVDGLKLESEIPLAPQPLLRNRVEV